MQEGATQLKTYFETNDVPTQQQYANLIESFSNLVDNNALDGFEVGITGVSPIGQGSAYPLTKKYNVCFNNSAPSSGVLLPTSAINKEVVISNKGTNNIYVYPSTNEQFLNYSLNAPFRLVANSTIICKCYEAGKWFVYFMPNYQYNSLKCVFALTQSSTNAPVLTWYKNEPQYTITPVYYGVGYYWLEITGGPTYSNYAIKNNGFTNNGRLLRTSNGGPIVVVETLDNSFSNLNGGLNNDFIELEFFYP